MTLAVYNRTATDNSGNVIPSAHVEVRSETPGQPLAAIYSDRDGLTPLGNPFDADSNGKFTFFAAGGAYRIRVYTGSSASPTLEQILRYEAVGKQAEKDPPVANADMAEMDAYSFKMNNTGSAAVPSDISSSELTTKSNPSNSDYVLIFDHSDSPGTGEPKKSPVSVFGGQTILFETKAAAQVATIQATVPIIALAGYTTRGDAPIAWYVRASSEPSHAGKLQSADGAWWEIKGPIIYVEQFGAVGDGVTDDLPEIQAAETCRQALDGELRFLANKNYYMNNPNSWIVRRPRWQGADHNSTILTMDGASSTCIWLTGAGGLTSGYMRDLVLWAPSGRTTGEALRLDGDSVYQPDEFTTSNLKITGTGSWSIPIFHYGAERAAPLGLRVVTHYNLFIGRDVSAGVYAQTVVQLQIYGGGIYGGTTNQLQVAGNVGVSPSQGCTDIIVMGFKINGQLNVDDCTGSVFNIICGSVVFGADADDNCIMGFNSGATTNSGTGNNLAALA